MDDNDKANLAFLIKVGQVKPDEKPTPAEKAEEK
jgi:hypothetical protein